MFEFSLAYGDMAFFFACGVLMGFCAGALTMNWVHNAQN